jgi:hypothetical protein
MLPGKIRLTLAMAAAFIRFADAQIPLYGAPTGGTASHLSGFNLYDVTGSINYLASGLPGVTNTALLAPNGQPFESNYFGTGSVTVGWERHRSQSIASIYYTPSYTANGTYPEWNNFGHVLVMRFGSPRRLSQKWRFNFSVDGNISNIQQFLFTPPVYANAVAAPGTSNDLSSTVLTGNGGNDQLSSVLGGAPIVESPARSLFFGDRILTFGGRVMFSYVPRTRWTVDFELGGARTQHLSTPQLDAKSTVAYITPYVNSMEVSIAASYSFTPKTQFGVVVNSNHSFTGYQDAYAQNAMATLGHKFGRHFFAGVQAGGGLIIPVKDKFQLPKTPQVVGGLTAGFKTRSSSFILSANKAAGDSFGSGYYSTVSTSAAWNYMHPGSRWWLYASFGQSWIRGTQFRDVKGWQGGAGFGRELGAGFTLQTQYSALTYGGNLGPNYNLSLQAVRVAFSWNPHSEFYR